MFKNSHLRLLMKLSGIQLMGPASEETPESLRIIPEDVSADHLKDTIHFINQAEFSPPTFEDGVLAENQLKRKTVPRKKAAFDDEEGDDDDDGFLDDGTLFPAGGPTARQVADEKKKPKKTHRKRRAGSDIEEADDSALEEKARKRREKELEKARRIKSALYVRDGDDEFDSDEDDAFFAREREIATRAKNAAATAVNEPVLPQRKRKSEALLDMSDDEDGDDLTLARRMLSSQEDRESETDDTPVDLSDGESRKRRKMSVEEPDEDGDGDEDMDVDIVSKIAEMADEDGEEAAEVVVARRPRVRGGFVMDSDDDE